LKLNTPKRKQCLVIVVEADRQDQAEIRRTAAPAVATAAVARQAAVAANPGSMVALRNQTAQSTPMARGREAMKFNVITLFVFVLSRLPVLILSLFLLLLNPPTYIGASNQQSSTQRGEAGKRE